MNTVLNIGGVKHCSKDTMTLKSYFQLQKNFEFSVTIGMYDFINEYSVEIQFQNNPRNKTSIPIVYYYTNQIDKKSQ